MALSNMKLASERVKNCSEPKVKAEANILQGGSTRLIVTKVREWK